MAAASIPSSSVASCPTPSADSSSATRWTSLSISSACGPRFTTARRRSTRAPWVTSELRRDVCVLGSAVRSCQDGPGRPERRTGRPRRDEPRRVRGEPSPGLFRDGGPVRPLLAGVAFGELFVSSVYRHLVSESALRRPDRLRDDAGLRRRVPRRRRRRLFTPARQVRPGRRVRRPAAVLRGHAGRGAGQRPRHGRAGGGRAPGHLLDAVRKAEGTGWVQLRPLSCSNDRAQVLSHVTTSQASHRAVLSPQS